MLHTVLNMASYPMPYVDKTVSTFDWIQGLGLGFLIVLGVIVAVVCGLRAECSWEDEVPVWTQVLIVVGLVAAGCAAMALLSITGAAGSRDDQTAATSRAAYDHTVITWMSTEYEITLNEAALHRLTAGKTLVASYRGADTLIEFAERTDSGLAVRIPDGTLLTPIDR